MSRAITLPPPVLGLNTVDKYLPFDSGYARELTNYSIINGALTVRPSINAMAYNASGNQLAWIDFTGGNYYCIKTNGDIRTVTTNAGATNIGGGVAYETTELDHLSLQYVIGAREPRNKAYPFTAWTCTTPNVVATSISSACSHKGRMYVSDGVTIDFSALGQITGAFTAGGYGGNFPVSSYMQGQSILRMLSVNVSGDGTQNLFVIFGNLGKILVYAGDFPFSSTWQLIGNFNMPIPISRRAFHESDGDIFVATVKYAYWLRDLLTGGPRLASDNSPSDKIQNLWQALGWDYSGALNAEQPHVYPLYNVPAFPGLGSFSFEQGLDAIVVQCSEKAAENARLDLIVNINNEAVCLVYFKRTKAWALWTTVPFFAPIRILDGRPSGITYVQEVVSLFGSYKKDEVNNYGYLIEATWKTPFLSPFEGKVQNSVGVRPYYKNTKDGYFHKIRSIFDSSDNNAPFGFYSQESVTAINPGRASGFSSIDAPVLPWNTYSPFKGVGGSGGGISYQFTQRIREAFPTAAEGTYANQIYSATAYIEDGGAML